MGGVFRFRDDMVDFNDGKYEVLLIKRPQKKIEVLNIIISMLRQNYSNRYITFFHASEIDIETDEDLDWAVDGECIHGGKNVHIKNHKHAVDLIMKKSRHKHDRKRAKRVGKILRNSEKEAKN